jgi:hypothetical protein
MIYTLPPGAYGSAATGEKNSTVRGACKAPFCALIPYCSADRQRCTRYKMRKMQAGGVEWSLAMDHLTETNAPPP